MDRKDLEKALQSIDCCMMTTIDGNKNINTRPMLQNKEALCGNNIYFFSMKDTRKIRDLEKNATISLTYQDKENTLFIQIHGEGDIVEKPEEMEPYWDKKLNVWWPQQQHTPGICMIRIRISHIRYWHQGENCTIEW